jgi:hypothetical protein
MRPAPEQQAKLWKGLERFVNCKDSEDDYRALSRSFPGLWPVGINYLADPPRWPPDSLDWHPVCQKLFLFYRDGLQKVWKNVWGNNELRVPTPEILLGLSDWNEKAIKEAEESLQKNKIPFEGSTVFGTLVLAWWEILSHFPTACIRVPEQIQIRMLWEARDLYLIPQTDFQKAFYLLFRQSWRARVCPRCKTYFVARKPKQTLCGTACSAGSRLASNRKWWSSVGTKRRASQRKKGLNRIRRGRRQR